MRLPTPPTLEHIDASIPRFAQVSNSDSRPFWSVMIPTYNSGHYLRQTLESVLHADRGIDRMHIEVVDGGSTTDDPQAVVDEIGRGRVFFHRLSVNQGPALTLNTCIARSRGVWVHILHGDDCVLPGFYEAYERVIQSNPAALTVVGQVIIIDEHGRWKDIQGPTPALGSDVLEDFAETQTWTQPLRAPGVVVRRSAYEGIGGYCTYFRHLLDWELYFRLAQLSPVACVGVPYSLFRVHSGSETNQLMESDSLIREPYLLLRINLERLGRDSRTAKEAEWLARWAENAETLAWILDSKHLLLGRFDHAKWAWMLQPTFGRGVMLLKSWLKLKLVKRKFKGTRSEPATATGDKSVQT